MQAAASDLIFDMCLTVHLQDKYLFKLDENMSVP